MLRRSVYATEFDHLSSLFERLVCIFPNWNWVAKIWFHGPSCNETSDTLSKNTEQEVRVTDRLLNSVVQLFAVNLPKVFRGSSMGSICGDRNFELFGLFVYLLTLITITLIALMSMVITQSEYTGDQMSDSVTHAHPELNGSNVSVQRLFRFTRSQCTYS